MTKFNLYKLLSIYIWACVFWAVFLPESKAANLPASYQANYQISRGGKVMAEQTTTLQSETNNHYTLTDVTKGTHGLASLTGFERVETSQFQFALNKIITTKHKMQQKVAFRKKSYQFTTMPESNLIIGQGKQSFTLDTSVKPISTHMLAWWLSYEVCAGKKHIKIPTLKSNQIKTYEFKVFDESPQFFRVDRTYPVGTQRSSQTWLDKTQQCLATKTRHQEADEPVIEIKLLTHHAINSTDAVEISAQ